eukprot:COSAG02_NODE_14937_length_1222_cov_0.884239_2_plen_47_part_01
MVLTRRGGRVVSVLKTALVWIRVSIGITRDDSVSKLQIYLGPVHGSE